MVLTATGLCDGGEDNHYRAVSLKVLENRLKSSSGKGRYTGEILRLAGLESIDGYILDEANQDIVLMGQVEAGWPPLYLEDFVVALRNSWLKYGDLKDGTYYYKAPGCFIEPDPQVLKRLQKLGNDISEGSDSYRIEAAIKKWRPACRSLQSIRVTGIPFHTHFARVLVTADYDMKSLVMGAYEIGISGFKSLSDITLDKMQRNFSKGETISLRSSIRNRFWFYPGENLYLEQDGIVMIKECPVDLLTEEGYLGKSGSLSGKEKPDELAETFAERFTEMYPELAERKPIYTELDNLFRFVALSKILRFKSAHESSGLDLVQLLDRFQVSRTSVSSRVPGSPNIKKIEYFQDTPKGHETTKVYLAFCGGVVIDINISEGNFVWDKTGDLAELKNIVLGARPGPDALYWDY